jgi:hypothetical protein
MEGRGWSAGRAKTAIRGAGGQQEKTHQADQKQGAMQGDLGVLGRRGDGESGVRSIGRHDRCWRAGLASQRAFDATTHLQAVGAAEGPREEVVGCREQRSPWSARMAPAAAFIRSSRVRGPGNLGEPEIRSPLRTAGQIAPSGPSGTQRDPATPTLMASGYANREPCTQAREGRKSAVRLWGLSMRAAGSHQHGPAGTGSVCIGDEAAQSQQGRVQPQVHRSSGGPCPTGGYSVTSW